MYNDSDASDPLIHDPLDINGSVRVVHDDDRNEEEEEKVGPGWAIWNLFNDVLTPGTIALPFFIFQAGLFAGAILMILFGILNAYTLCLIYELKRKFQKNTYPELAGAMMGMYGYGFVCFCMFAFNYGGLCAQLIMFKEAVPPVLEDLLGSRWFFEARWVLIFSAAVFLPISFFKNITKFRYTSFLSVSCVFIMAFLLAMRVFWKEKGDFVDRPIDAFDIARPTVFSTLGGLAYIYVCHDLSFNVIDSLKNPTRKRYYSIVTVTMTATVITTVGIGSSGYMLFFDTLKANVWDNFPENDLVAVVARVVLALDILITIPFSVFMPRVAVLSALEAIIGKKKADSTPVFLVVTVFLLAVAITIAEFVSDLGAVVELAGGVGACMLAYILPPLLMMKAMEGSSALKNLRTGPICALTCGLLIMIGSTAQIFLQKIHIQDKSNS